MKENNFSKSIFVKSIILTILLTAVISSMITIIIMNNEEYLEKANAGKGGQRCGPEGSALAPLPGRRICLICFTA